MPEPLMSASDASKMATRVAVDLLAENDRFRAALRTFAKVSMFETRPTRHEYHVGWQDVDGNYGPSKQEIEDAITISREA